jgi:DNA-binding transcriptional regulator YdaS (Cro superfamily)
MDLKTYIDGERGRATKLAAALGISPSYLSQMASGTAPISTKVSVKIEDATEKMVTRKDLHPIDWPEMWPELVEQTEQTIPTPDRRRTKSQIDRETQPVGVRVRQKGVAP